MTSITENDFTNGRYIGEGLGAPEASIVSKVQSEATDVKRMQLLAEGVNLGLYTDAVNSISSRVTVCNGLFLEWGPEKTGVKVRINELSPYYLVNRDKRLMITDPDGTPIIEQVFLKTRPDKQSKVFTEQLSGIFATSLYGCELVNLSIECKFCASGTYSGFRFSETEFADELTEIMKDETFRGITVNGGSFTQLPFRGYELMESYMRLARNLGVKEINIELMPNPELPEKGIESLVGAMKKDGVTSVQFNLEIWNPDRRVALMPYKGRIPRETYLMYLRKAADILGLGKASSVVLIGLNPLEDLQEAADAILSVQAVPALEMFRPLPGTLMEKYRVAYDFAAILRAVGGIRQRIYSTFKGGADFEGCLRCGGCGITLPNLSQTENPQPYGKRLPLIYQKG